MFAEFRDFIAKGNVMELAVAVIIAGAFGVIVASMTNDLIMPLVGAIFGDVDFSSKYVVLSGEVKEGMSLEAARKGKGVAIIPDIILANYDRRDELAAPLPPLAPSPTSTETVTRSETRTATATATATETATATATETATATATETATPTPTQLP